MPYYFGLLLSLDLFSLAYPVFIFEHWLYVMNSVLLAVFCLRSIQFLTVMQSEINSLNIADKAKFILSSTASGVDLSATCQIDE